MPNHPMMEQATAAHKKEAAKPPAEPKIKVDIDYQTNSLIMSAKDAAILMDILKRSEMFVTQYNQPNKAIPLEKDAFTFKPVPDKLYLEYKLNYILGIEYPLNDNGEVITNAPPAQF